MPSNEKTMGASEHFERVAWLFYKATGMLAIGKDDTTGEHSYEDRQKAWLIFTAGRSSAFEVPSLYASPSVGEDTRRLDWLQSVHRTPMAMMCDADESEVELFAFGWNSYKAPTLREAIDAAMGAVADKEDK